VAAVVIVIGRAALVNNPAGKNKKGRTAKQGTSSCHWQQWLLLLLKAAAVVIVVEGGCSSRQPCKKNKKNGEPQNKGPLLLVGNCNCCHHQTWLLL